MWFLARKMHLQKSNLGKPPSDRTSSKMTTSINKLPELMMQPVDYCRLGTTMVVIFQVKLEIEVEFHKS